MRVFLIAMICFLPVANSYGQHESNRFSRADVEITKEAHNKISVKAKVETVVPGLDSLLANSIEKNLDCTVWHNKQIKQGKYLVALQFVVTKDSSISDIRRLTNFGFGMENEVIRVVMKYWGKTKWEPAPQPSPVREDRTSATTSP